MGIKSFDMGLDCLKDTNRCVLVIYGTVVVGNICLQCLVDYLLRYISRPKVETVLPRMGHEKVTESGPSNPTPVSRVAVISRAFERSKLQKIHLNFRLRSPAAALHK